MDSFLHWSPGWWVVINALAVYRITRLVVRDEITRPVRAWLDDRYEGGWLLYLVTCFWCVSVYVATGVILLTYFLPFGWSLVAAGLAVSAIAGFLGERVA